MVRSRSRYRYSQNSYSRQSYDSSDYARRHIEEAKAFSAEIGGTDEDVKKYFFGLAPGQLEPILKEYGQAYGSKAEDYARETLPQWRSGTRRMSGMVAKRLFDLLPKRMPLALKYELAGNIWRHFGPTSRLQYVAGVDTPLSDIEERVSATMAEVVTRYNIPENVSARFKWLSDGDISLQERLLNHFRQKEKELAVQKVRAEIPVLQRQVRDHPVKTHLARTVLVIHRHEISVTIRSDVPNEIAVEQSRPAKAIETGGFNMGHALLWGGVIVFVWFWIFGG